MKSMASSERITVRFPSDTVKKLQKMAATQNTDVSVLVRDFVNQGLERKASAAAQAPLIQALHDVLPGYFEPLAEAVVATRFDTVMAREMATASVNAVLMYEGELTPEQARELLLNTKGQAVKTAQRRVRELPKLVGESQGE